jgi:hypothetical protein
VVEGERFLTAFEMTGVGKGQEERDLNVRTRMLML